jgi:hypothetical protein
MSEALARLLPLMAVAYDAEHVGECSADEMSMECPACDAEAALWTAFRDVVFGSPPPVRNGRSAVEALRALPLPAPAQQGESREASAMREVELAGRILSGALQEGIAASEHNDACKWNACVCWIGPARKRLEAWHATMKAIAARGTP